MASWHRERTDAVAAVAHVNEVGDQRPITAGVPREGSNGEQQDAGASLRRRGARRADGLTDGQRPCNGEEQLPTQHIACAWIGYRAHALPVGHEQAIGAAVGHHARKEQGCAKGSGGDAVASGRKAAAGDANGGKRGTGVPQGSNDASLRINCEDARPDGSGIRVWQDCDGGEFAGSADDSVSQQAVFRAPQGVVLRNSQGTPVPAESDKDAAKRRC